MKGTRPTWPTATRASPEESASAKVPRTEARPTYFPASPRRTGPDALMVELAAKLLRSAKQPVFICGGGVVISRAESELLELAEKLSAPVATSISGKGSIDEQHALAAGVVGSNGGTPETR